MTGLGTRSWVLGLGLLSLWACTAPLPEAGLGVKVSGPGKAKASSPPASGSSRPSVAPPAGPDPTSAGPRGAVLGGVVRWGEAAQSPQKLKASLFAGPATKALAEWEAEGDALALGQSSFSFPALPQGRYRLLVQASDAKGASLGQQEQVVEVAAGDARFVELALALPPRPPGASAPPLVGRPDALDPSQGATTGPSPGQPLALPSVGIGIVILRPSLPPGWGQASPSPASSLAPQASPAPSPTPLVPSPSPLGPNPSPQASPSLASPSPGVASPSPAASPTIRPSVAPSPTPTPRPSVAPSPSPTPRPSVAPSVAPSPSPVAPNFEALVAQGLARDALNRPTALVAGTRLAQLAPGDMQALVAGVQAQSTELARIMLVKAALVGEKAAALQGLSQSLQGRSEGEVAALCLMRGGQDLIQQWADSCGPAIVQTMQGEANPVRALALHREPSHTVAPFGACQQLAGEQKTLLERYGGVAVPRGQAGGVGIGITALLNQEAQPYTEASYAVQAAEDSQAFTRLEGHLQAGHDVPIRIAFADGASERGHFMVVLNARGTSPSREALIHDPYTGSTAWLAESAMQAANFRPFFVESARWTHLYAPSGGFEQAFFRW